MSKFLDQILRPELPDLAKNQQEKTYEIKRLSKLLGEPVTVTLRGLPYGRVQDLERLNGNELEIHILLAGCEELRDPALLTKYGVATPDEVVKRLLLPGEITALSKAVEGLCGYRQTTIKEVKN